MTVLDPVEALRKLPAWQTLGRYIWALEAAIARSRSRGRPQDDTRSRIAFAIVVFAVSYVCLAVGASRASLFSGLKPGPASVAPAHQRADLVDRHGGLLAINLTNYGLFLSPKETWNRQETTRAIRSILPDVPLDRIDRVFKSGKRSRLIGGLTPDQMVAVRELGVPGLDFETEEARRYPAGETAAHILGFTDKGGAGISGVEKGLDKQIRQAGADGTSVPLSIDTRVQAILEEEVSQAAQDFQTRGAVGIIMDVHTGELLGMASYPSFDPNRAGSTPPDQLLNRASGQLFEMGSTFKAFTVAVGLETGVATPSTLFDATHPYHLGYRTIEDYHATNRMLTLVDVFTHSSNIGTARLGVAIGPERLNHYFSAIGLTRTPHFELNESARPLTPRKWDEDAVASISFGHGMLVSPLALARAYAPLLNGGTWVDPTLRRMDHAPVPGARIFKPETSQTMLQIMRVNVVKGTGGKADVPGYSVGGKTGTGEKVVNGKYDTDRQVSSFAAVFPTEGPLSAKRYFVLILMDEPKGNEATHGFSTGGWVAAPAAGRVIARVAPLLGVNPVRSLNAPAALSAASIAPSAGL
jgi:cell division protein FtsI (penicillin-binding protein 3)